MTERDNGSNPTEPTHDMPDSHENIERLSVMREKIIALRAMPTEAKIATALEDIERVSAARQPAFEEDETMVINRRANHTPEGAMNGAIASYRLLLSNANEHGVLDIESEAKLDCLGVIEYSRRHLWDNGYLLSLPPIPDNGVQYIFGEKPTSESENDAALIPELVELFDFDAAAEAHLLGLASDRGSLYRRMKEDPQLSIFSYGPLEVRIGIDENGEIDARIGWEFMRKSDDMGATQVTFEGVKLKSPERALACIESRLDEIDESAQPTKDGIASAEDVEAMAIVYAQEAAGAKEKFLAQLRINAPELETVSDERLSQIFDEVVREPRRRMYRDKDSVERHIVDCMLEPHATISYGWDSEASEIQRDYIHAWAPHSYIRVEGIQGAIVEDYNADPHSYAGGGKKIAEHELNLKPEELASIRQTIFRAKTE